MYNQVNQALFELKPSKTYLLLTMFAYGLTIITVVLYSSNLILSMALLAIILGFFWYSLLSIIKINQTNSVTAFYVNPDNIVWVNAEGGQTSGAHQIPIFQSIYCVILVVNVNKKQSLVVFKDSLVNAKMSDLNRLLTIYKPDKKYGQF